MTARVIHFPSDALPAQELLDLVSVWEVKTLVAMGEDRNGGSFFVVSTGLSNGEVLWMLEKNKLIVLR